MSTLVKTHARHRLAWLGRGLLARRGLSFQEAWPLIEPIEGWLVAGQEEWLFRAAQQLPEGANLLEIGSFKGRSTCSLALGCVGSRKRVFAIDTFRGNESDFVCGSNEVFWQGSSFHQAFVDNVESCGVSEYVVPLVGASREAALLWAAPIHLLFLDGSHQYQDVLADFTDFYPWVIRGGLVAFHDVTPGWEGPYRVWIEHAIPLLRDVGSVSTLAFGWKP